MGQKTEAELRQLLNDNLPFDQVEIEKLGQNDSGSDGVVSFPDPLGVTRGEDAPEQAVIDRLLYEMAGKKVGYEIERVREILIGGHCYLWFKRKTT